MTREEQIRQASIEYTYQNQPMCIGGGAFSEIEDEMNRNHAFEEGAKWVDEHPNLTEEEQVGMGGLGIEWQKQALLTKVYDWLDDNWYNYCGYTTFNGGLMIEDLKREMEEEL